MDRYSGARDAAHDFFSGKRAKCRAGRSSRLSHGCKGRSSSIARAANRSARPMRPWPSGCSKAAGSRCFRKARPMTAARSNAFHFFAFRRRARAARCRPACRSRARAAGRDPLLLRACGLARRRSPAAACGRARQRRAGHLRDFLLRSLALRSDERPQAGGAGLRKKLGDAGGTLMSCDATVNPSALEPRDGENARTRWEGVTIPRLKHRNPSPGLLRKPPSPNGRGYAPNPPCRPSGRRRSCRKTGLQKIAAGRGFPIEHFAGDENAGLAAQHEIVVDLVEQIPPAVEIARAIGAMPVMPTGTALISAARRSGERADNGSAVSSRASCRSPIATGGNFSALRSKVESDGLRPSTERRRRASISSAERSGRKAI